MSDIWDMLFGNKALKTAASTGGPPQNTPQPSQPATLDIAAMAQQQADAAAAAKRAAPIVLPPTPKKKKKPLDTAGKLGAQMSETPPQDYE